MKTKKRVLCVCAYGLNRSKYLARYLKRKGYDAKSGGVEATAAHPIHQVAIDWAEVIIIVRKRLAPILKKHFKTTGKRLIILDVSDSPDLLPKEYKELVNLPYREFQKKWTYPQLRKEIKPYLPL